MRDPSISTSWISSRRCHITAFRAGNASRDRTARSRPALPQTFQLGQRPLYRGAGFGCPALPSDLKAACRPKGAFFCETVARVAGVTCLRRYVPRGGLPRAAINAARLSRHLCGFEYELVAGYPERMASHSWLVTDFEVGSSLTRINASFVSSGQMRAAGGD
jgi:hypothetical protein